MKSLLKWVWHDTSKPVFAAIVFAAGVIMWGGFNTAMEVTNTMTFCVSCHEMRDNVYAEYQKTVHYQNRSGVRAICSDCHVPKSWGHKVIRKIKATKEVFHWALGTIDTPEKFDAHRLQLARNVWEEMESNGSRECKNCHAYDAMHAEKQGDRAKKAMKVAAEKEIACIACHKGLAHKLPNFEKHFATLTQALNDAVAKDDLSGNTVVAASKNAVYMDKDEKSEKAFDANPLTQMNVLERDGDWLKVRLDAWDREGGVKLFKKPGPQMEIAKLGFGGMDTVQQTEEFIDKETELTWHKVNIEGWVKKGALVSDASVVRKYADELWRTDCQLCHTLYPATQYVARDWVKETKAMRRFTKLEPDMLELVKIYLQDGSKDMVSTK
ncbi:NapC/NirT family cytochrome c [Magnetovibrio sp. PR-2]|uniref:NapC/NirT family cytochrome c n=1 Tax=Magnetovibrio sp. PR-2 TaxID=3120356 RepID=UPI002FCE0261